MPDTATLRALVDGVLVFAVIEAVALVAWHRRSGRGAAPAAIAATLAAGALLMLALRFALTPGLEWLLLPCLAGAGACHVVDIRQRSRR